MWNVTTLAGGEVPLFDGTIYLTILVVLLLYRSMSVGEFYMFQSARCDIILASHVILNHNHLCKCGYTGILGTISSVDPAYSVDWVVAMERQRSFQKWE